MNNIKNSLDSIQNSIASFDNKATSLLTAVGVIFSFSLLSLDLVNGRDISILFFISAGLYLLSFVVSIICLILVIVPRRKSKSEKDIKCNLYQRDVFNALNEKEFKNFIEASPSDDTLLSQVKICAKIAHTKETLLSIASVATIFLVASLVAAIVFLFC